ncbi:uncharacterized protein LOC131356347 isoform X2 [Hemibagrus wyckioides]|uniref:uncharacterized protein LOC131356347 isoform X2 n=1 Tax=Hemibagrus wyckioides TaxID=337641 RepID=UPI00266D8FC2|nr:uncharacterized protein LOC131356347 isoform X2 [Hemibagrus wyckioides]
MQKCFHTDEDIPEQCCFRFSTNPIPVKLISAYVETDPQCPKPGVIFTLKNGGLRCGDPSVEWVQDLMNTINQRLSKTPTEKPDKPVSTASLRRNDAKVPKQCCYRFQTKPFSVSFITAYRVTDRRCAKRGVIFTLKNGCKLCADPCFKWVKDHMKKIDQLLFNSQNNSNSVFKSSLH